MNLLKSIPLKYKLPAVIVGLCLILGTTLEAVSALHFRAFARQSEEILFDTISHSRQEQVLAWYDERASMVRSLATAPSFVDHIEALDRGVAAMPGGTAALRQTYVGIGASTAGASRSADAAVEADSYGAIHAVVDGWLNKVLELNDYYDVFLVDAKGLVLYSVAKEDDYMTNLLTGPYAGTGLGDVVSRALGGTADEVFLSDLAPYAASQGAEAMFMASQVSGPDGNVIGAIAVQLNSDALELIVNAPEGLGETGQVFILGADARTRTASRIPGEFATFEPIAPSEQVTSALAGKSGYFTDTVGRKGGPAIAAAAPLTALGNGWSLVVEMDEAEITAESDADLRTAFLTFAVLALVATGLGIMFSRAITLPLGRAKASLDAITAGNLDITIADADRADEIGGMAIAMNGLLDTLNLAKVAETRRQEMQAELGKVVQTLNEALQDLAGGDLTKPITAAFSGEYDGLRQNYNATLEKLASTISQVVDASQSIRGRSQEIASASEDLSRRTENQAAALEETAAALDELTSSIKSAAEGSREVEDIVRRARQEAEDSGVVVQGAVAAMSEIEKSSEQISQIIGAIDDIAFQTNLLALNAGVEAARAGDAGKGFAVVASEVRALAQRSSAAAKEIKSLIVTSAQHVRSGVEQVGKAGEALHSIVGSVANISTLVSDIAAGAAEQSTGLAEINIGVTQLDQVTQQNAAMAEQSTAASHSLNQDALGLADLVSLFSLAQSEHEGDRVVALSQFAPRPASSCRDQAFRSLSQSWRSPPQRSWTDRADRSGRTSDPSRQCALEHTRQMRRRKCPRHPYLSPLLHRSSGPRWRRSSKA